MPTCTACEAKPPKPPPYSNFPNGCGAKGGRRFPQGGPIGLWFFGSACDNHDICYGTCGNTKAACDAQFAKDLLAACDVFWNSMGLNKANPLAWGLDFACREQAGDYVMAVQLLGDNAYKEAQNAACKDKKCVGK